MAIKIVFSILSWVVPAVGADVLFHFKDLPKPSPSAEFNNLKIKIDSLNDEAPFLNVYSPETDGECRVQAHYDSDTGTYSLRFRNMEKKSSVDFEASSFDPVVDSTDLETYYGKFYVLTVQKGQKGQIEGFELHDSNQDRVASCFYE